MTNVVLPDLQSSGIVIFMIPLNGHVDRNFRSGYLTLKSHVCFNKPPFDVAIHDSAFGE